MWKAFVAAQSALQDELLRANATVKDWTYLTDLSHGGHLNAHCAEVPKVLGNLLKGYAGTHFEYDAHRNLAMKTSPRGQQRYDWDSFDRLVRAGVAETGGRHQTRDFYGAFNRRIAKEVDGDQTVFGWDGDRLAFETTVANVRWSVIA